MSTRVVSTAGALYSKPRASRKRRRCDGHLRDRHFIEPGELVVWSALPPDHAEFGNTGWRHHVFCVATCAPPDTLPRPTPEGDHR